MFLGRECNPLYVYSDLMCLFFNSCCKEEECVISGEYILVRRRANLCGVVVRGQCSGRFARQFPVEFSMLRLWRARNR